MPHFTTKDNFIELQFNGLVAPKHYYDLIDNLFEYNFETNKWFSKISGETLSFAEKVSESSSWEDDYEHREYYIDHFGKRQSIRILNGNEIYSSNNLFPCPDCKKIISVHANMCLGCGCSKEYFLRYYKQFFEEEKIESYYLERVIKSQVHRLSDSKDYLTSLRLVYSTLLKFKKNEIFSTIDKTFATLIGIQSKELSSFCLWELKELKNESDSFLKYKAKQKSKLIRIAKQQIDKMIEEAIEKKEPTDSTLYDGRYEGLEKEIAKLGLTRADRRYGTATAHSTIESIFYEKTKLSSYQTEFEIIKKRAERVLNKIEQTIGVNSKKEELFRYFIISLIAKIEDYQVLWFTPPYFNEYCYKYYKNNNL